MSTHTVLASGATLYQKPNSAHDHSFYDVVTRHCPTAAATMRNTGRIPKMAPLPPAQGPARLDVVQL